MKKQNHIEKDTEMTRAIVGLTAYAIIASVAVAFNSVYVLSLLLFTPCLINSICNN